MATAKTILMVDDDHDFVCATKTILESGGYEVITASSGTEGYETAKSKRPDLILVDVIMDSYTDGFDLLRNLALDAQVQHIPRILLTSLGLIQELDMMYPAEFGTQSVLQKPIKADELLKAVSTALGKATV